MLEGRRHFTTLVYGTLFLAFGAMGSLRAQEKVYAVGKNGLQIEGAVAKNDPKVQVKIPDLKKVLELPAKMYSVKLSPDTLYRLDLASTKLDSYLVLQDQKGNLLAADDDSGMGLNSRVFFNPPKDDVYKIFSAAYDKEGDFTLTIAGVAKIMDQGQRVQGELNVKSRFIIHQVKLIEGKSYQIDMTSSDTKKLDPILKLLDARGKELAQNDDISQDNLNARLIFKAPATGTYQIFASSFLGQGEGPFTLFVEKKD